LFEEIWDAIAAARACRVATVDPTGAADAGNAEAIARRPEVATSAIDARCLKCNICLL
jgi:hypothetical protein